VGPRAGVDTVAERKNLSLFLMGIEIPVVQSIV
jgi:hypothetical protein